MQLIKSNFSHLLFIFFFKPAILGMYGFAICFTVLVGIKVTMWFLGSTDHFIVDIDDVRLSLWGFGTFFVIKFLMNVKHRLDFFEQRELE